MKKLFITSLVAAATLSSCKKEVFDTPETEPQSNKIEFSTYATQQTRGLIVGNTSEFLSKYGTSARGGFKVSAFTSTAGFDSEYLSAQINLSSGAWNYVDPSDVAYWPTSGSSLDFFAYAPYTGNLATSISTTKTEGMKVVYTVPTVVADQVDFMFASALDVTKDRENALADNRVSLTFKHALTQLKFKGYTTSANLKVDVKANGISVVNIPNSGTLTVPATSTPASWAVGSSIATYPTVSNEVVGLSTTLKDIATTTPILVIPSNFEPWKILSEAELAAGGTQTLATAQNGAYLAIECRAYVEDPITKVKEYLFGTASAYKTAYVPFDDAGVWAPSKVVTYTLNFDSVGTDEEGEDNLIRIDFTADAADWENVADQPLDM